MMRCPHCLSELSPTSLAVDRCHYCQKDLHYVYIHSDATKIKRDEREDKIVSELNSCMSMMQDARVSPKTRVKALQLALESIITIKSMLEDMIS